MGGYHSTPEQHHNRHHTWRIEFDDHVSEDMDTCWRCQRASAHCRTKRRFPTGEVARETALAQNIETEFVRPVYAYSCRWCRLWHLATAKRTEHRKRAEKQRRKWRIRELTAAR